MTAGSGALQDTWEWDGGALARPGETMQVAVAAAGASPTSAMQSLAASFYAGGVGYPSGVATGGAELVVWDEGEWKVVATNGDLASAPNKLEWTTTDPAVLSRLLLRPTLDFAVRPTAASGTGTGEVAVDYAEVTLRYRLP